MQPAHPPPAGASAPGPQARLGGRALGRARREAMLMRARRIRRSVAALTVAIFAAAFLAVYVQLASGHDPALTSAEKRRTQAASATRATTSARSTGTASAAESSTGEAGESASTSKASESNEAASSESAESSSSSSGSGESSTPSTVRTGQS